MIAARTPGSLLAHTDAPTPAADRHAAFDLSGGNRACQRNHQIGVVVIRIDDMRTEIHDLMSRRTQLLD